MICYEVAPIAQLVQGRLSDEGGLRFESQTGQVRGKSIPSLWMDRHSAIMGLQPPRAPRRAFHPEPQTPPSKQAATGSSTAKARPLLVEGSSAWVAIFVWLSLSLLQAVAEVIPGRRRCGVAVA